MGEAKRKRLGPCRCGTGKPAGSCCLSATGWHKKPIKLDLRKTGHSESHSACYLRETNACCDRITGEHMISESVLRVLAQQKIRVSGTPWLDKGETKVLTFGALTTNCLCRTHNSALSNIDAAGGRFFSAVQKCGTTDSGPNLTFLFSGHDIERWFLKTLLALGTSKNFSIDGVRLNKLHPNMRPIELLEDASAWGPPLGMYATQSPGQMFTRSDSVGLAPLLITGSDDLVGLMADVQGVHLGLLAINHPIKGTGLDRSIFRPKNLFFKLGRLTHTIQMCWEDSREHIDITFQWTDR